METAPTASAATQEPAPTNRWWWRSIVERYEKPSSLRSLWQITNSMGPYLILWGLMIWALQSHHYWLTLLMAPLAAGFLVRIFIISHDCGHGAMFKSPRVNRFWGVIASLLCATPYHFWLSEHGRHHGASGNLDRRGVGDIWTLTVQEYLASSRLRRIWYRIYRNPFMMFGPGAFGIMALRYRIPKGARNKKERLSVLWTNVGLLGIMLGMTHWIGLKEFLMIIVPILSVSSATGVWLFYVQHQYEGVRWDRNENWDFLTQAIESSSYYRLPRVLQWFTGNIGYHHVHHLSHRIPNYNLEKCHRENEIFSRARQITLWSSLKSLTLRLWDEEQRKLVGYRALRMARRSSAT